MTADQPFSFVQFEFGFLLGPPDGRYLVREDADAPAEHVLALKTLGAPQRRLRGRRGSAVDSAEPEPVPTTRATVIRAEAAAGPDAAAGRLAELRGDPALADAEIAAAQGVLNRALHAFRTARADPHTRDVSPAQALAVRIGYGSGEAVAEGRFHEAWELPRGGARRTRRSMEAPDERFAALLGGREQILACEELVVRARGDLAAGRPREAALQARVALEAVLAELDEIPGDRRPALEADREAIGAAANAALRGQLDEDSAAALDAAVGRMESALRARRLGGAAQGG